MFDELLDLDRDGRDKRNGGAAPRRGGIRGLIDRLLGGDDGDDRRDETAGRRDQRSRRDDRNDRDDLFGD